MCPRFPEAQSVEQLFALIPEENTSSTKAIEKAAKEVSDLAESCIYSPYKNRFSVFRYSIGISPAFHKFMHLYEEQYYDAIDSGRISVLHLYSDFSGIRDTDWASLPSPLHDTFRPEGMVTRKTEVVKEQNDKHRSDFNKARELNIIDENGTIYCISSASVSEVEAISRSADDALMLLRNYIAKLDSHDGADTYAIQPISFINAAREDTFRESYVRNYGAWKYVEHMLAVYNAAMAAIEQCKAETEKNLNS